MKDTRREELIHGEIDDLISEFERSELREILEGDDDAREFHSDMTRLTGTLDRVDEVDPPVGLRQSILDEIASRQKVVEFRPKRRPSFVAFLQYSAVLAAGLILGLVVAPLVSTPGGSLDPADLGGSMLPGAAADGTSIELASEGLSGEIRLDRADGLVILTLRLEARGPVEVVLGYDGGRTGLAGLTRHEGTFDHFEARGDRVALTGTGSLEVSMAFDRWEPGNAELHLMVRHSGETVHDGRLSLENSSTHGDGR